MGTVHISHNPAFPTTLTDKPPALEGTTISEYVAEHVRALHATRKAFIETESSEQIHRALCKQTRTLDSFSTGDTVYYKRSDSTEWKGPGVVIGQDGVVVFVQHGGSFVGVHRCRLMKTLQTNVDIDENSTTIEKKESIIKNDAGNDAPNWDDLESEDSTSVPENTVDNDIPPETVATNQASSKFPQVGQLLEFHGQDGELNQIKVLSWAGKATGALRNWYNAEY
ncbi:hypothetical protein HOLleu_28749 [Holothuria leucospilota]|uniref:Uncharacterized protein n=1 Tax=Holothuria leucospilota TaxID=206669 RepID=A0A9Q1H257_HOLLE|nr:hypothetical protein HOLleu_28749 [Holothuria leucospilota]